MIVFLIFVGLTAEPETQISCTEIINSPVTIVWQILTDPDRMPEWYDQAFRVELDGKNPMEKNAVLILYYSRSRESNFNKVKVENFDAEKQLSLKKSDAGSTYLLKDYKQDFKLKSLLDGTTEITCHLSYQPATFFTRIFNKLFLQKKLDNQCSAMLHKLKLVIEKV